MIAIVSHAPILVAGGRPAARRSGCGAGEDGSARRPATRPSKPSTTVLDAWKAGETPESLEKQSPPIHVKDADWNGGFRLVGYKAGAEGQARRLRHELPRGPGAEEPQGQVRQEDRRLHHHHASRAARHRGKKADALLRRTTRSSDDHTPTLENHSMRTTTLVSLAPPCSLLAVPGVCPAADPPAVGHARARSPPRGRS